LPPTTVKLSLDPMWKAGLLLIFSFVVAAETESLSPERQQILLNMLKNDCGACHGLTLKGGLGPSLLSKALTDKSDKMLVNTILLGRDGTAMPSWKKLISKQEAFWLIHHLKNTK